MKRTKERTSDDCDLASQRHLSGSLKNIFAIKGKMWEGTRNFIILKDFEIRKIKIFLFSLLILQNLIA